MTASPAVIVFTLTFALSMSGCAGGEVELRIGFDDSLDLARLDRLHITVGGDDHWDGDVAANDRVRTEREARVVYRAAVERGTLDFTVEARDGGNLRFAGNTLSGVELLDGRPTPAFVRLAPLGPETPTDLPAADGPLPDLGADANPPSLCAAGSYLKCEDFETPLGTRWTPLEDPPWATLSLSTARAYRGSSSLRISGEVFSADLGTDRFASAYLVDDSVLPLPALYFRAFVYAPSSSAGGFDTALLTLRQTASPNEVAVFGWRGNRTLHLAWGGGQRDSVTALPTNRWVCVEWMFAHTVGDGGALQMRVWLDGVEVPDLTGTDPPRSVPFGRIELGVYKLITPTTPALELYIDEVVLHDQRVGCMN